MATTLRTQRRNDIKLVVGTAEQQIKALHTRLSVKPISQRSRQNKFSLIAHYWKMMDVSHHKSVDTLRGYVRDAELFCNHAGLS